MDSFSCDCVDGYEGDRCDVNHDDCLPNPCENGGGCQVSRENTEIEGQSYVQNILYWRSHYILLSLSTVTVSLMTDSNFLILKLILWVEATISIIK